MTSTRVALFDIDGTLARGLLIVDFPRYLVRKGHFDEQMQRKIGELAWRYRRGRVSYRYISTRIPAVYAQGLAGQDCSNVRRWAADFLRESTGRLFPYSARLVSMMVDAGFRTVAISGSPLEVLLPLKRLGFDKVFGSEMRAKNGCYTGSVKRNLILAEEKQRVVRSTLREYNVDTERSFAFGDTEQDLPLLKAVGNPVVLNPNPRLARQAARYGWPTPQHVVREVKALLVRVSGTFGATDLEMGEKVRDPTHGISDPIRYES